MTQKNTLTVSAGHDLYNRGGAVTFPFPSGHAPTVGPGGLHVPFLET